MEELAQIAVLNQMVVENSVVTTEQIIRIAVQMEEKVVKKIMFILF